MKKQPKITREIVRRLREPKEIAKELECSKSYVYSWAKNEGVRFDLVRLAPLFGETKLIKKLAEFNSQAEIANMLALSPQYINQVLQNGR